MSYKALYRKYRPSTFENVFGQDHIVKTLKNAIYNNKIGHAYLFCGTRGTGKTTIAKIFSRMINCLEMKENMPCGKCEICTANNIDDIADIIEIDAASNNGVDEIRELKNKIKLVPVLCKYKVYIIDEVHMLSTGAFNALLKTLEEPPEHAIFILATTEPQKLPITIISRCQRFDFKKISVNDIFKRLRYISDCENIKIDDDALYEISRISDGALRDSICLLEQVSSFVEDNKNIIVSDIYEIKGSISFDELINLIKFYLNNDNEKILEKIEDMYLKGKDFNLISQDLLLIFRNIYVYKKAKMYFDKQDIQNKEIIIKLSNNFSIKEIENIIKKLDETINQIRSSHYPNIIFETFLLDNINNKEIDKNFSEKIEEGIIKKENLNIEKKVEKKIDNVLEIENNESRDKIKKILKNEKKLINKQIQNKDIIINNTIALASIDEKKYIINALKDINRYLVNDKYKICASIIEDSNIVACSVDHILFTCKYESIVNEFDNNLLMIINLLYEIFNKKYVVAAITEKYWNEKRPYYVNLMKTKDGIKLIEEIIDENNDKIENNEIIDNYVSIFGNDLIEMEDE